MLDEGKTVFEIAAELTIWTKVVRDVIKEQSSKQSHKPVSVAPKQVSKPPKAEPVNLELYEHIDAFFDRDGKAYSPAEIHAELETEASLTDVETVLELLYMDVKVSEGLGKYWRGK